MPTITQDVYPIAVPAVVRREIAERGPRIIIPLAGEEIVLTVAKARALRDELSAALRGLEEGG